MGDPMRFFLLSFLILFFAVIEVSFSLIMVAPKFVETNVYEVNLSPGQEITISFPSSYKIKPLNSISGLKVEVVKRKFSNIKVSVEDVKEGLYVLRFLINEENFYLKVNVMDMPVKFWVVDYPNVVGVGDNIKITLKACNMSDGFSKSRFSTLGTSKEVFFDPHECKDVELMTVVPKVGSEVIYMKVRNSYYGREDSYVLAMKVKRDLAKNFFSLAYGITLFPSLWIYDILNYAVAYAFFEEE